MNVPARNKVSYGPRSSRSPTSNSYSATRDRSDALAAAVAAHPSRYRVLTATPEIPGLDGRKMSKSYGNAIALSMTADQTATLIRRTRTDAHRTITFDPEHRPGISALLTTAALCTGIDEQTLATDIGDAGAGALEKFTADAVNDYFAAHRRRRADLARDPEFVRTVLRTGNERADEIANRTLDEVRAAMGTTY
ncbi:hypothetical protein [Nocardia sp. NPDC049526]|uniref:hypothetical protein n=1 Tax=Nocardia sp. NPDC049526 TaxID=3364316 RepID=UPI0037AD5D41